MPPHKFLVPKDHTLDSILGFGNELLTFSGDAQEFLFDFQGKGFSTPFGMLYLAFAIREFRERHPATACRPLNYGELWYPAHMGYFQACGFEIGKLPGQAPGSETYLPITILPVADFHEQAKREIREVGDVIESHSKKLSAILAHQPDGPLVELLTYSFRELIRNILEHSQSERLAFCAQYHHRTKQAEIAILDTGRGIRASLSQNPYLNIGNDHQALNLALMPGISGKQYKGVRRDPYAVWQNSGYGLFAVSRLCGHGGKFMICSGDSALVLKPGKKEYHPSAFQGTALRVTLSAAEIRNTKSTLAQIMKEGDKQAKELNLEGVHASAASRMLSTEFREEK